MGIAGSFLLSGLSGSLYLIMIVTIPGLLLWGSISLFDVALDYTVFDFYKTITDSSGKDTAILTAIKQIWVMTRDMANILIISAFVYISIAKILSIAKDYRREIVTLLTVAILINFSFFFTLTAIDVTNWTSVQIYNAMLPANTAPGETLGEILVSNMGGVQMITSIGDVWDNIVKAWDNADSNGDAGWLDNALSTIAYLILSLVLTLLGAIMFFRIAFILIARLIILFVLLASSSLAFAAMLIPPFRKYWVAWRNGLLYNSIIAPLMLLMLYIVTIIMQALYNSSDFIDPNGQLDSDFVHTVLIFFVGIGLLWAAIRVSTILSNKAAGSVGGFGRVVNGLLNKTQNMGMRGLVRSRGWALRNTLGRSTETLRNRLGASENALANRLASSAPLRSIATSSYDSKNTQKFMEQAGISIGSGVTEGFKKIQEQKDKNKEKIAKEQYDNAIEGIEAEKGAYAATDSANSTEKQKLKDQEQAIKSQQELASKLAKENAEELAKETSAENAQAKTVDQKEKEVENIKQQRTIAGHTAEESKASMAAETTKINNIRDQIKEGSKNLQLQVDNGTISIDSPEYAEIEKNISSLKAEKRSRQKIVNMHNENTKLSDTDRTQNLERLTKQEAQLSTEHGDAKTHLDLLKRQHAEAASKRAAALSSAESSIQSTAVELGATQNKINSYEQTLNEYQERWKASLANTSLAKAAKGLSDEDKKWLADNHVGIADDGSITEAPTSLQLSTMSKKEFEKMNTLLGQHAESAKFMAKIIKDASTSKKDRQTQEENDRIRAVIAAAGLQNNSIADTLTAVNDKTKKDEEEESK